MVKSLEREYLGFGKRRGDWVWGNWREIGNKMAGMMGDCWENGGRILGGDESSGNVLGKGG
jgi:hypothetical protein